MKILIVSKFEEADYLCDMVTSQLLTSSDFELSFTNSPSFLFDNYPSIPSLYGRGYSIYGKIPSTTKVNIVDINSLLASDFRIFDFVIYPSIRRDSSRFDDAVNVLGSSNVISIDGEDDFLISHKALSSVYFKRELISCFTFLGVLPISFFIPILYFIHRRISHKKTDCGF